MALSQSIRSLRIAMRPERSEIVYILGEGYRVEKELGKGKGGYSYLVQDTRGNNYTLKCFHHEVVDYYTFSSSKVDLEIDAYSFLSKNDIKIPRLLFWDKEREIILKEFIPGDTALYRVSKGEDLSLYFPILSEIQNEMRKKSVNLDWFPSNFIYYSNSLYYIDYEISPYEDKWSFENWGINYWMMTNDLREYLSGESNK